MYCSPVRDMDFEPVNNNFVILYSLLVYINETTAMIMIKVYGTLFVQATPTTQETYVSHLRENVNLSA